MRESSADHRHRAVLEVGDVDVAGLGAGGDDCHPGRVCADGDGGDDRVVGGVDHRHRAVAGVVGDVDVAGGAHRHPGWEIADGDGRGHGVGGGGDHPPHGAASATAKVVGDVDVGAGGVDRHPERVGVGAERDGGGD